MTGVDDGYGEDDGRRVILPVLCDTQYGVTISEVSQSTIIDRRGKMEWNEVRGCLTDRMFSKQEFVGLVSSIRLQRWCTEKSILSGSEVNKSVIRLTKADLGL